jgi:hypothetical protein
MNNIWSVDNENDIINIFQKNNNKLVTILFTSENNNMLNKNIYMSTKKTLKRDLASKYKDEVFIYVNISDYSASEMNFFAKNIVKNNLPYLQIFLGNKRLCVIENTDSDAMVSSFNEIKNKKDSYDAKSNDSNKDSNKDSNNTKTCENIKEEKKEEENEKNKDINTDEEKNNEKKGNDKKDSEEKNNNCDKENINDEVKKEVEIIPSDEQKAEELIKKQIEEQQRQNLVDNLRKKLCIEELEKIKTLKEKEEKNKHKK